MSSKRRRDHALTVRRAVVAGVIVLASLAAPPAGRAEPVWSGTINTGSNPVDWTKLKSVPTGLADGIDNNTTYRAGTGLALLGSTISIAPGGVDMAAVNVPIGTTSSSGHSPLLDSTHLYNIAPFTPAASGACLVTSSVQVHTTAPNSAQGPFMRVAYKRNGADHNDGVYGHYLASNGQAGYQPSVSRTTVVPVTAGDTYEFGVFLGSADATWQGDQAAVRTTYLCV